VGDFVQFRRTAPRGKIPGDGRGIPRPGKEAVMAKRAIDGMGFGSVEAWEAREDETRRLMPGRSGLQVRVEEGLVLVTQAGDPEDHVLGPGEELRLAGAGLAVAWAFRPSRVLVVRDPVAVAAGGPPAGVAQAA
jgi:Protein of unknown function (DUF2917)